MNCQDGLANGAQCLPVYLHPEQGWLLPDTVLITLDNTASLI